MSIKEYVLGGHKDPELFGYIGRFLVDKAVHDKLGTAVVSQDSDMWWVMLNGKNQVRGFSTARVMKNDALHLRFVFCVDDETLVLRTLLNRVIKFAEESYCKRIFINERTNFPLLEKLGFSFAAPTRGSFVKWEKIL
jgi:hypothetical protein